MLPIFRKYKLATFLNVLGLAVALAAFYLCMTQVVYNTTYNSSIPDADRTYRMEICRDMASGEWNAALPMPFIYELASIPQLEQMANTTMYSWDMNAKVGKNDFKIMRTRMSATAPEFFGVQTVYGSMADFCTDKCAITRSEAVRLFGKENAVGESVQLVSMDTLHYTVCAVVEDLPENTPIYWWLFPLALCLVSAIVMLTVVAQCWRVANGNPIESIKTE